jgi:hypothetical protein
MAAKIAPPVTPSPTPPAPAGAERRQWSAADGGSEVSLQPEAARERRVLPRLTPCPPFFYMAHPRRHQIMRDSRGRPHVLPVLHTWRVDPGASNVDVTRDGRVILRSGLQIQRERGWIDLPHDIDGRGTSYLRRVEVEGGVAYMTRFETAWPGEDATRRDDDAYIAWVQKHMASGRLPSPHPQTLTRMQGELQQQLVAARRRPPSPEATERIAELEADLAAVAEQLQLWSRDQTPDAGDAVSVEAT